MGREGLWLEGTQGRVLQLPWGGGEGTPPKGSWTPDPHLGLSVLKRCVPKTLAIAFGSRLRSKTQEWKEYGRRT